MSPVPASKTPAQWTFLTNHAHVLLSIVRFPTIRMRELADRVGITERAVQRIVADLAEAGYVQTERQGRRNCYQVRMDLPLRHSIERHRSVLSLVDLILEPSVVREDSRPAPASRLAARQKKVA